MSQIILDDQLFDLEALDTLEDLLKASESCLNLWDNPYDDTLGNT